MVVCVWLFVGGGWLFVVVGLLLVVDMDLEVLGFCRRFGFWFGCVGCVW